MQRMLSEKTRRAPGVLARHSRTCRSSEGGTCNCTPSYRAWVFDRRSGGKVFKTFSGPGAFAAAKRWRVDATNQLNQGKRVAYGRQTLRDAAEGAKEMLTRPEVRELQEAARILFWTAVKSPTWQITEAAMPSAMQAPSFEELWSVKPKVTVENP